MILSSTGIAAGLSDTHDSRLQAVACEVGFTRRNRKHFDFRPGTTLFLPGLIGTASHLASSRPAERAFFDRENTRQWHADAAPQHEHVINPVSLRCHLLAGVGVWMTSAGDVGFLADMRSDRTLGWSIEMVVRSVGPRIWFLLGIASSRFECFHVGTDV